MKKHFQNNHHIHVVGICGSLRERGFTRHAVNIALQGAQQVGVHTSFINLNNYQIPFCRGREHENMASPDVLRLKKEIEQAHGIILGTPEYHGSYSGVLKNMLDLMGFAEFEGKMMGLVGVSGGMMGAHNALNGLRNIGRSLHAWVIPEQASIPKAWQAFDEHGQLKDAKLETRVKAVGKQVARFAFLHTSETSADFIKAWETALANPGGSWQEEQLE